MKKLILFLAIVATIFVACKKSGDTPSRRIDRLEKLIFGTDTLDMYVGETRQVPLTILYRQRIHIL